MKIAILGAGISGVSLARMLAADGHAVTVLEKSDRAGGLCKSRQIDGFTFDDAGGHIMFSKNQQVLSWMKDRCGGEDGIVETVRKTRIRWHDRWVPYPFENGVGHLTKEAIADCLEGYIESYADRKNGSPCPERFGDWIDWRMGSGFAKHFMVPYNQKIWECDLNEMSSGWVAGRVPEAPIRDVLNSAIGLDSEGYTHQSVLRASGNSMSTNSGSWFAQMSFMTQFSESDGNSVEKMLRVAVTMRSRHTSSGPTNFQSFAHHLVVRISRMSR